jgi:signal transduction histidine kinase
MTEIGKTSQIPAEQARQLRQLSHDLSNAFEVILQTSFLLGTVTLDENARQWRQMLDQGVQRATQINQDLREYIRIHTENAAD